MNVSTLLLVLGIIIVSVIVADRESSCRAKGFDTETLLCGICAKLEEVTGKEVGKDCLQCCYSPYASVKLSASQIAAMRSSGLNDFVSTRKSKFQTPIDVEITMSRDEQVRLVLESPDGETTSIRVTHWGANDLEDYLAQYFARTA